MTHQAVHLPVQPLFRRDGTGQAILTAQLNRRATLFRQDGEAETPITITAQSN